MSSRSKNSIKINLIKKNMMSSASSIKTDRDDMDTAEERDLSGVGGVDPTMACTAAAHGSSGCSGPLQELNKLSSYLDLISKSVTRDSGTAAMERAIIKSRLRIPFWKADEVIEKFVFFLTTLFTPLISSPRFRR